MNPRTILTAWLYQATRHAATDLVRRESRRQAREQIAFQMSDMNDPSPGWTHIEPLLDEAMQSLDDADRTAILLRYFENKSLQEVGQALGASEDAAQKRVSRALERLRGVLSKRKIAVGASGLAALVSANAVQAAPCGLAGTVATGALLASTTLPASTSLVIAKTVTMTTIQKTIIAAMVAEPPWAELTRPGKFQSCAPRCKRSSNNRNSKPLCPINCRKRGEIETAPQRSWPRFPARMARSGGVRTRC